MFESYAGIRQQDRDTLADSMCDLIRRGRWLLIHPDMRLPEKLAEIDRLFTEYAPPPGAGFPGPGEDRAGAATAGHSDILARPVRPGLFTDWAAAVTGEEITAWMTSISEVPADSYPELQPQLSGEHTATRREGLLITRSGQPVAEVSSVYLPGRLPAGAAGKLHDGVPLGRALAPRVRRQPLPGDAGRTRGLLWVPGPAGEWPAALAAELLLI